MFSTAWAAFLNSLGALLTASDTRGFPCPYVLSAAYPFIPLVLLMIPDPAIAIVPLPGGPPSLPIPLYFSGIGDFVAICVEVNIGGAGFSDTP